MKESTKEIIQQKLEDMIRAENKAYSEGEIDFNTHMQNNSNFIKLAYSFGLISEASF